MSKTYSKTRILVECALMIALGTVLANIKIYELANGGSVTLFKIAGGIAADLRPEILEGLSSCHRTGDHIGTAALSV